MSGKFKKKLKFVLMLLLLFFVIELSVGFLTNSLALVSDAGHMLTDIFAIGISLLGFKIAENKATRNKTYGFYRAEIIAAFLNGIMLILVSGYIVIEAFERLKNPTPVKGLGMLIVAIAGLIINIIVGIILFPERRKNLNMRSAYLHVLGDTLGSIQAVIAGIIIITTQKFYADTLASLAIAVVIVYGSIGLLKDSINVLMEGVPLDVNIDKVKKAILEVPDVMAIHDLHVWMLSSGKNVLTAHISVKGEIDRRKLNVLLTEIETAIKESTNIDHITIQIEPATFDAELIIEKFTKDIKRP